MPYRRFFFLIVLALHVVPIHSAPVIQNPSFEDSRSLIWPGWTSVHNFPADTPLDGTNIATGVPGWTAFKVVGLNPILGIVSRTGNEAVDSRVNYYVNPLANNGRTPDGTNVLFLQNGGRISQNVAGFEANKSYVVHLRYNARAGYATPDLHVRLGGLDIGSFQPVSVNPDGVFTDPYYFGSTDEFTPPAAGSYLLEFIDMNEAVDNSVLLDVISIEELSDLTLLSAKRDLNDASRVTVAFSDMIPAAIANSPASYSIQSGGGNVSVLGSHLEADGKTVTLTTEPFYNPDFNPILRLVDFADKTGKRPTKANSEVAIEVPPLPAPKLSVESHEGRLLVHWPSPGYALFRLQFSTSLQPGSWNDAPLTATDDGARFEYEELNTANSVLFYRLLGP